jgi:hypothetical protein
MPAKHACPDTGRDTTERDVYDLLGVTARAWLVALCGQIVAQQRAQGSADPLGERVPRGQVLRELFSAAGAPVPAELEQRFGA